MIVAIALAVALVVTLALTFSPFARSDGWRATVTPLASIIGFVELTKAGTMLNNATFRPFLVYSMVALIYFCLCYPLSWYAKRLEKRLNAAR